MNYAAARKDVNPFSQIKSLSRKRKNCTQKITPLSKQGADLKLCPF